MLKVNEDNWMICENCGDYYLRLMEVQCSSAADGDRPYHGLAIRAHGGGNLCVETISEDNIHRSGNRKRELDAYMLFSCEGCSKVTAVDFSFHKGITTQTSVAIDDPHPCNQIGLIGV